MVGEERRRDSTCEEQSDDREPGKVIDRRYFGDQDLDPDEAQDRRDRLVDIAKAAYEQVYQGEEGAKPEPAA